MRSCVYWSTSFGKIPSHARHKMFSFILLYSCHTLYSIPMREWEQRDWAKGRMASTFCVESSKCNKYTNMSPASRKRTIEIKIIHVWIAIAFKFSLLSALCASISVPLVQLLAIFHTVVWGAETNCISTDPPSISFIFPVLCLLHPICFPPLSDCMWIIVFSFHAAHSNVCNQMLFCCH